MIYHEEFDVLDGAAVAVEHFVVPEKDLRNVYPDRRLRLTVSQADGRAEASVDLTPAIARHLCEAMTHWLRRLGLAK